MKILMVLESEFPPDVRVENEMLALSEAGHEVHLTCSTRKNRPQNELFGKAVIHRKTITSFIYKSSVGCLKFPFYFNFWRSFIFNLCANEKFDVIHIHDLPLSKVGVEVKRRFNIPLIIDLHENWPALIKTATHTRTFLGRLLSSNKQWIEYERKMLPEADKVITIIEEARDRIIGLGIEPEKICMVSNTINFENLPITAKKKEPAAFTIFYGGAINKHRGLQIVLKAIKICVANNIDVRLWIVGNGSFRKELEELSETLNIKSHVHFLGQKPFHEMLEILAKSDIAIIPHLRTDNNDASSPNKLYQYMYLNKPIVSSDCTSLKRIINETHTGFIYKNDSAGDLASLIGKLHKDRSLLDAISDNGRKAVMAKYNWNVDKERLIKAYSHLAENNN
ncbi:MAG: glycosyltransferase family 4 protein [Bacteroidetes bacterium]|nr:glycosyltransferase family 4 protein [Bacteroidota bacterium]